MSQLPNSALESLRDKRGEQGDRGNYRGRGRGSYINYYEDLGFSTTEPAYKNWKEEETKYKQYLQSDLASINASKKKLGEAEEQYNNYKIEIPDLPNIDDAWNNWRSTNLVPVSVADYVPGGGDNEYKIEATYYVPKDFIGNLTKANLNVNPQGDGSYLVATRAYGHTVGGEAHRALSNAQGSVENEFRAQANAQLEQVKNSYNQQMDAYNSTRQSALDEINNARAQIDAAEQGVRGTQQLREEQMVDLRGRYQQRLNTLRELFTGKKEE